MTVAAAPSSINNPSKEQLTHFLTFHKGSQIGFTTEAGKHYLSRRITILQNDSDVYQIQLIICREKKFFSRSLEGGKIINVSVVIAAVFIKSGLAAQSPDVMRRIAAYLTPTEFSRLGRVNIRCEQYFIGNVVENPHPLIPLLLANRYSADRPMIYDATEYNTCRRLRSAAVVVHLLIEKSQLPGTFERRLKKVTNSHPGLKTLNLSRCHTLVFDPSLAQLSTLTSLHTLDLTNCKITNVSLVLFEKLSLQVLRIAGCVSISDTGLKKSMSKLTSLRSLDFRRCSLITDVGLESLSPLTLLESLDCSWCSIKGPGLVHLVGLPLTFLNVSGYTTMTDLELRPLRQLTLLKFLDFNSCHEITDAGLIDSLKDLTRLQSLGLAICPRITGTGVMALRTLSLLRFLSLSGCRLILDDNLELLVNFHFLQTLNLSHCSQITDIGVVHIEGLISLEVLDLSYCPEITDDSLKSISKLTSLRSLGLRGCNRITNVGLTYLIELHLEALDLRDCPGISNPNLIFPNMVSLKF